MKTRYKAYWSARKQSYRLRCLTCGTFEEVGTYFVYDFASVHERFFHSPKPVANKKRTKR